MERRSTAVPTHSHPSTTDVPNRDVQPLIRGSHASKREIDDANISIVSPTSSVDLPAVRFDCGAVERDSHAMERHLTRLGPHMHLVTDALVISDFATPVSLYA